MKYLIILSAIVLVACSTKAQEVNNDSADKLNVTVEKLDKSEEEWKAELSEMEYYVLRKKGTERAFTGDLWDNKKDGVYTCAACGLILFNSDTKFKSGSGWPSFFQPVEDAHIAEDVDYKIGYKRVEVLCSQCGGHLGHVFEDGPKPTGLRYCINSVSLDFIEGEKEKSPQE